MNPCRKVTPAGEWPRSLLRHGGIYPSVPYPAVTTRRHPGCATIAPTQASEMLKRVIVTPTVYPCFIEFVHFDIQSTGQKSHCFITHHGLSQCFVLIKSQISLVHTRSKSAARHQMKWDNGPPLAP